MTTERWCNYAAIVCYFSMLLNAGKYAIAEYLCEIYLAFLPHIKNVSGRLSQTLSSQFGDVSITKKDTNVSGTNILLRLG